VNPAAVDDPQARVRAHKKKLKAKKIITSLTQNGSEMTLTFAGTEEEQKNFIEAIKEWRANE
jgi:G:T/U-mismatch repair DNA glycosylase